MHLHIGLINHLTQTNAQTNEQINKQTNKQTNKQRDKLTFPSKETLISLFHTPKSLIIVFTKRHA